MTWEHSRIPPPSPIALSRAQHNKEISKSLARLAASLIHRRLDVKNHPGMEWVGRVLRHLSRGMEFCAPPPFPVHIRPFISAYRLGPDYRTQGAMKRKEHRRGVGRQIRLAGKKVQGKVDIKGLFSNCFRRFAQSYIYVFSDKTSHSLRRFFSKKFKSRVNSLT